MRRSIYLLTLATLALVGCASEPTTVTTTTTTREVTTTGPASEVVVARTPPPVRVETQPLAPGRVMYGQAASGGGREPTMCGYQGAGSFRRDPPRCGSRDTGRTERSAGCDPGSLGVNNSAAARLYFEDDKVGGQLTAGPIISC